MKNKLIVFLNDEVSKGLLQLSGNIFVTHNIKPRMERKANTTVEQYVNRLSEEAAKDILNMLTGLNNGDFVSYEEADKVLDEWLDVGEGSPSNRDIVEHDKIDKELLHSLVTFALIRERFPK